MKSFSALIIFFFVGVSLARHTRKQVHTSNTFTRPSVATTDATEPDYAVEETTAAADYDTTDVAAEERATSGWSTSGYESGSGMMNSGTYGSGSYEASGATSGSGMASGSGDYLFGTGFDNFGLESGSESGLDSGSGF